MGMPTVGQLARRDRTGPDRAAVQLSHRTPATREALRRVISGIGHPYLVLRLGLADPDVAGPPHTPRLPGAQTIDD
ncbi:hypothetical protein [Phytohabitans rumicis]